MEKVFISREYELRQLRERIFTTQPDASNGPISASLTGPTGIGKHALVNEARRIFEEEAHPGVFIVEREFSYDDTLFVFFLDLLKRFQKALTEIALKAHGQQLTLIEALRNQLNQAFTGDALDRQDCSELRGIINNVMETCREMGIRVILILYSLDIVMKLQEREWSGIIHFLDSISQSRACDWYLNTLLVSDMQPQFIARPVLSGSVFQAGYPPIQLHNFNDAEMDGYFASLPGGTPSPDTKQAILRHCGRYPAFLMDFRNSVSDAERIDPTNVSKWARNFNKGGYFHRIHTLLNNQYVDANDSISALEVFTKYFLEGDQSQRRMMQQVFLLGLADERCINGVRDYTPITEYCTSTESTEDAFLSYLSAGVGTAVKGPASTPDTSVIASWLHLSDLHVSEEPDTHWLLQQFRELSGRIKPDFLVITGDFRDKKERSDYSLAAAYLKSLLECFKIAPEDVYLVPGNHDAEDSTEAQKEMINNIVDGLGKDNYYCYKRDLPTLYSRFSAFQVFCKDLYRNIDESDKRYVDPQKTHLYNWRGKLNILCANTALISDGRREHQEIVDLNGILDSLEGRTTSIPTIMLGHHDLKSLYSSHKDRLDENFKQYHIAAYLHGDVHKSSNDIGVWYSENNVCPSFGCGKSAPKSGDNYSDYSVVYYEWRNDGNVYVKWYKRYDDFGIKKLDEDLRFRPSMGVDVSFSINP